MAFCRAVFTVLLLSVVCNASVPVLMWGDVATPNLKYNPLETTSPKEFGNVLTDEIGADTLTVIFEEESLSVEDLSSRNEEGQSSYPYLHSQLSRGVYLPSVRDAVPTLRHLAKLEVKQTEEGLSAEEPENAKFLFINLEDVEDGESRVDMLRRHDELMREKVAQLKKDHPNVIAIYTGRFPSWTIPEPHLRYRRQAASNSTGDFVLDGLRLYVKSINIIEGDQVTPLGALVSSTTEIGNSSKTMNTTLNFPGNTIILNFNQAGGYWFFESVSLSDPVEELTPDMDVYSLIDFAYRCAENVTFSGNSTRSLFFEDLKIQPAFYTTNESSPVVFGDSFNCVGFFSAPIWSGLFVVFILLAITFYGIMMMMDIRTMDRFDDPKGKTITINAGE